MSLTEIQPTHPASPAPRLGPTQPRGNRTPHPRPKDTLMDTDPAAAASPEPLDFDAWRRLEESALEAVAVAQRRLEQLRADAAAAGTDLRADPIEPIGPDEILDPMYAPAVFLRSRSVDSNRRNALEDALCTRGWHIVRKRLRAWQLARTGVPVAIVDINPDRIVVGMLHAKYADDLPITDPDAARLNRINGGHYPADSTDDEIALHVHTALGNDPRRKNPDEEA